jgi:anti-sigma regulatory factor (Ser/Thr protein kinase)
MSQIPMKDESTRVEFHLDRDPRLISAVRSAVHFQALRAGLEETGCENIAIAAEEICREALTKFTDADGGLDVTLETFADRMEISIHHRGQLAPTVGLETFALPDAAAGGAGGLNGMELLSRVDRVMYNAAEGIARTTLVKFLQHKR